MSLQKHKPDRNSTYLDFVRNHQCCVCVLAFHRSAMDTHVHHIHAHAMGAKCSDYFVCPLCPRHHREIHDIGRKRFAEKYKIDLDAEAKKLRAIFDGKEDR